jgi:hypothetical protein
LLGRYRRFKGGAAAAYHNYRNVFRSHFTLLMQAARKILKPIARGAKRKGLSLVAVSSLPSKRLALCAMRFAPLL